MPLHEFLDCHYGPDGDAELRARLAAGGDVESRWGGADEVPLHVATAAYKFRPVNGKSRGLSQYLRQKIFSREIVAAKSPNAGAKRTRTAIIPRFTQALFPVSHVLRRSVRVSCSHRT
jgi:hypothetical protein